MFFVLLGEYSRIQNICFERGTPKIALIKIIVLVKVGVLNLNTVIYLLWLWKSFEKSEKPHPDDVTSGISALETS